MPVSFMNKRDLPTHRKSSGEFIRSDADFDAVEQSECHSSLNLDSVNIVYFSNLSH